MILENVNADLENFAKYVGLPPLEARAKDII